MALALLADDRLDALITDEVAFEDLPRELPRLLAPGAPGLATVVRYVALTGEAACTPSRCASTS